MKTSTARFAAALIGATGALSFGSAQAVVLDLSGGTNVCATTNGALVCSAQDGGGSTGSGTFPAFVQGNTQDNAYFMYNTTGAIESGNEVGNGANQNKDVVLSDFAVTTRNIGGTDTSVFTFVLDINEPNSSADVGLLSVNQISIFLGNGALSGYVAGSPDMLGATAASWSMDASNDILLSGFTAGQGKGDMFLYVPVSFFGAAAVTTHLQLYSLFGLPSINDSGFEEWSYQSCTNGKTGAVEATCYTPPPCTRNCDITVPEPGTLALFGLGLLGVGLGRRKLTA